MRRFLVLLTATTIALGLAVGSALGGGETVKAKNFKFAAKKVTIQKGDKVTWKNVEGRHTVTFRNGSFDKALSGSKRVSKKFNRTGTFRYYCRPHKSLGMKGKVVVE
jgi:plastocyanin